MADYIEGKTTQKARRGRGRPTKYNEEVQAIADEYVENYYEMSDGREVVPTIAGLARMVGVNREVFAEWGRVHPDFHSTLVNLKAEQETATLSGGLTGRYNSTVAKMLLAANHGYVEKTGVDHTSSDGTMSAKPTRVEIVGIGHDKD